MQIEKVVEPTIALTDATTRFEETVEENAGFISPLLTLDGTETSEEFFDLVAEHMRLLGITEQDVDDAVREVRAEAREAQSRT